MKPRREKHRAAEQVDWPELLRSGVLAGAVALVVVSTLIPSESSIAEGSYATLTAGWCVLLIGWCLSLLLDKKPGLELGWTELAATALIAWHTLAGMVVLFSGNGRYALNSIWLYIGYGLTAWIFRQTLRTAAQIRALVAAGLWLALLLASFGFYQYLYSFPQQRRQYEANPERILVESGIPLDQPAQRIMFENRLRSLEPLATFALTNSLAGLLAPWLCAALAVALAVRAELQQRRTLIAALAIAVALAACLVLTKSRTAYLATAAGVVLVGLYCRPAGWRLDWRIPVAVGGVLVILGLVGVYLGGLDAQVLSESPKSVLYRLEYWRATAALIADHPLFGCGPGNFKSAYAVFKLPQASETISDPHNFLLETWATSGTPGVVLLLLVVVACAVDLSRGQRQAHSLANESGSEAQTARRTIFGGALAGLLLAMPMSLIAEAPLLIVPGLPALPVVWLLGIPLLALCWWCFEPWIAGGRLLLAALVVPQVALLVNLLAAGALEFPGVVGTLLVLAPAALCHARLSGEAAGGSSKLPRSITLSHNAAAVATFAASVLTLFCLFTEYQPVLNSRARRDQAKASLQAGRIDEAEAAAQKAAAADPRWHEPWQFLADLRLHRWLTGGSDADWQSFVDAAEQFRRRDPRHHLTSYACGTWYLAAWRKSGRPEFLEQAIADYRESSVRYPNWALYHAQLAWALHLAGREAEALSEAEAARRLDEATPHADKKLRVQQITDPQIEAGVLRQFRPETAEQVVARLRNTVGSSNPQGKSP